MTADHRSTAAVSRDEAIYYHNDVFGSRILVRILSPFLTGRVLEVGAGAGFVTTELASHCREVVAIEPTNELFVELQERTKALSNVTLVHSVLNDYVKAQSDKSHVVAATFDTIVYINVLEHIEADRDELSIAKSLLSPDGKILIVVPAHQWLYAKVDQLTGHFRRYSKRGLRGVIDEAHLSVQSLRYFDAIGLLPYLLMYKWLRSTATAGTNAVVYSRLIMPISYFLYRLTQGRLIGKNLIAVAKVPQIS